MRWTVAGAAETLLTVGTWTHLLTGAFLAALAAMLLWKNFRSLASRAFALLLAARSLVAFTYTFGRLSTDAATAAFWWRLTPYFVVPLTFLALAFAAAYPTRVRAWYGKAPLLLALLGAAALDLVVLLEPTLFWDAGAVPPGSGGPQDGAPVGPMFVFYGTFVAAYGLVAFRCARTWARHAPGALRSGALLVALGFGVVALYDGLGLVLLTPEFVFDRPALVSAVLLASLLGGATLALASAAVVVKAGRRRGGADATMAERTFVLYAAAAVSVAVVAVLPGGPLKSAAAFFFGTLWRLALPLLVAYALLRHRIFGIDLKLRWTIERGTLAAAFLAAFFVVAEIAENFLDQTFGLVLGGVAAGLLLFALTPLQRIAQRVGDAALPGVAGTSDYFAYRKLAIYRAAVEGAWADRGLTATERTMLDRLRAELDIRPEDASAIEGDVMRQGAAVATA